MSAYKFEQFGGMIPAVDARLLPEKAAALSRDAYLYNGTAIGWRVPRSLFNLVNSTTRRAYRIPVDLALDGITDTSYWVEFDDVDTDVFRTPVVDDSFQRYYFASPSAAPKYNTVARIAASQPAWLLGIPAPTAAPTVLPSGGGAGLADARTYVYTYVSSYGEEGPPSDPTFSNGFTDDTWDLTITTPVANDMGVDRTLATTRIYRTVVGTDGTATYFLVVEVPASTTNYSDTLTDAEIALNNQLESTTWDAPPSDLKGFVSAPNGMVVGFRENEIWFCEPFRPHAWPAAYVLTSEYPIVGLGVCGQSVIAATSGYPVVIQGVNPSAATATAAKVSEPCHSRGSIVSRPDGVYFASRNGLIRCRPDGTVTNVTLSSGMLQREDWKRLTPQVSVRACLINNAYFAFGSVYKDPADSFADNGTYAQQGFTVDAETTSPDVKFGTLTAPNSFDVYNVMVDPWTATPLLIQNQTVYYYDFDQAEPTYMPYLWRSKIIQQQAKKNFEAMRVWFDIPSTTTAQAVDRTTDQGMTLIPGMYGVVRVYAGHSGNTMSLLTDRELRESGELLRIASGQKYEFWQWEVEAYVQVYNIQAATSVKELMAV